jgi:hypothetical protein
MIESHFLGQPYSFWMNLQQDLHKIPDRVDLLKEIYDLRAKVSFYESRIQQMNEFKEAGK